jgi:hypothetical protein
MTPGRRLRWTALAAIGAGAVAVAVAAAGEDFKFMPKGGRTLLVEVVGAS